MADLYSALETAVSSDSVENILKNLNTLLSDERNIVFENISTLKLLLCYENNEVLKLTAQAIAESGKNATNREILAENEIIKSLLDLLESNKNVASITQICRALGNICYENDDARKIMNDFDGMKKILPIIEFSLSLDDSSNTHLTRVTCGLLFNYLISNETAQKNALQLNILSLVEQIIQHKINSFSSCEDVFTHLLHVLSVLTEQLVDSWFSDELCLYLINILELSMNPEISEFCLELLHGQAENDDIKLMLAQNGLCELLFNLLEQHKSLAEDEESRALMKLACDLIVLILTGNSSMTYLYGDGVGKVYKDMQSWLQSDDCDLLITGVLAVGNFARNDVHCIKMVQDGLSEILLDLLSKCNKVNDDIRLQHALLSALRNLVIPAQNKSRILASGLVDIIYPMLSIEQYPVVFKLLGTLRMVIDGQEKTALQLIMREDFLEKLVYWCFNSDHPGVRAESPRLLAWLIKHSHSSEPFPSIVGVKDCIRCLVEMIHSSHAVMQNEALLALNLLCVYDQIWQSKTSSNLTDYQKLCDNAQKSELSTENSDLNLNDTSNDFQVNALETVLVNSDFGKFVAFLLNKYHDKMEKEVLENLLTLLEKMSMYREVLENLMKNGVSDALKKCLDRNDLMAIYDRINKIISSIESG